MYLLCPLSTYFRFNFTLSPCFFQTRFGSVKSKIVSVRVANQIKMEIENSTFRIDPCPVASSSDRCPLFTEAVSLLITMTNPFQFIGQVTFIPSHFMGHKISAQVFIDLLYTNAIERVNNLRWNAD